MFSIACSNETTSAGLRSRLSTLSASHTARGQSWIGPLNGFQTLETVSEPNQSGKTDCKIMICSNLTWYIPIFGDDHLTCHLSSGLGTYWPYWQRPLVSYLQGMSDRSLAEYRNFIFTNMGSNRGLISRSSIYFPRWPWMVCSSYLPLLWDFTWALRKWVICLYTPRNQRDAQTPHACIPKVHLQLH